MAGIGLHEDIIPAHIGLLAYLHILQHELTTDTCLSELICDHQRAIRWPMHAQLRDIYVLAYSLAPRLYLASHSLFVTIVHGQGLAVSGNSIYTYSQIC